MRIRPPELETSICDVKYHVSLSTGCVLGKWVFLVTIAMSLFDLQDICIVIGSLATLDLPMVVDLIGIYVLKGPYCTLTTIDWFLQSDGGFLFPVVDLIKEDLPPPTVKSQFPCDSGWSQAPRRQQGFKHPMGGVCLTAGAVSIPLEISLTLTLPPALSPEEIVLPVKIWHHTFKAHMANQIKRRNVSSLTYENFPGGHPSQYCSHPCTLNSTIPHQEVVRIKRLPLGQKL
ncbi:hypothetical protein F511_16559 [Dorcoceras hygrometricum]|uniref:Uncharacterized protein n=1 Tax=Dorcoceras hygrometricum TaxID=472368 RepID=A0A2Z7AMM7_9LAMI|nr:hypothetical protein F511_16559 [Dorcoceras hygrometricum]